MLQRPSQATGRTTRQRMRTKWAMRAIGVTPADTTIAIIAEVIAERLALVSERVFEAHVREVRSREQCVQRHVIAQIPDDVPPVRGEAMDLRLLVREHDQVGRVVALESGLVLRLDQDAVLELLERDVVSSASSLGSSINTTF